MSTEWGWLEAMKSYGQYYTTLMVCIEETIWAADIT